VAVRVSLKLVRVVAGALTVAGAVGATYQAYGSWRDLRRFRPPGRLVEVGGRHMHLWYVGDGVPSVVMVSALPPGLEWPRVQRELVPDIAVALYDRADLGWSDLGPRPRSARRMADEFHQLLEAGGVRPPYVLVGHSLSGLVVRLYAARHPGAVAGMVLVDPAPEDYQRRIGEPDWRSSILGCWLRAARLLLHPCRMASGLGLSYGPNRTAVNELLALARGASEARTQAATAGRPPVTVLTGGSLGREHWYRTWLLMQEELVRRLSRLSTHVVAGHGGHHVHLDDPQLVVRVIRQQLMQHAP
jgi:pimeloyl-ACP methyl ester carboxylesterase